MASDESKDAAMEAQGGSGEPAAGASGAMKDVPFDARDLTGRTVLITGASRGLGKVLAVNLAGRGVGCLVLVARGEAALEETAVACRGVDGASAELRTLVCSCDLGGGPKEVKRLMDVVGEGGITKIDVLVANAGIMPGYGAPPAAVPDELEEACFAINVVGTHFLVKYALPLLTAGAEEDEFERTVVITSSNESYLEKPSEGNGLLAYRASKAGVNGLMVGLHALYGVPAAESMQASFIRGAAEPPLKRICCVHPGYTQTALGHESEKEMEPDLSFEEVARRKAEDGDFYHSVEEGVDSLVWAVAAANGAVTSGKLYEKRAVVPF